MDLLLKNLPTLNNHFHLHNKIGQGTFSNVYLATLRNSDSSQKFAVKHLIQACEQSRIQSELKCLKEIGGKDNVVSAELCLTNGNDCVAFVMPYLPHLKFADYVNDMDVEETRLYMKNLFVALKRVHSFNIIHRDVKPDNFLYNREKKQFLLVDFGLAQLVRSPNEEINRNNVTDKIFLKRNLKNRKRIHCNDDDAKISSIAPKRIALKAKENDSKFWNSPKILTEKENNENKSKLVLNSKSNKANENNFEMKTTLSNSKVINTKITNNFINTLTENKSPKTTSLNVDKFEYKMNLTNEKMMENIFFAPSLSSKTSNICSFKIRNGKMTKIQKPSSILSSEFISSKKEITSTLSNIKSCSCSGKAGICSSCSLMERMDAPRGGTSGFRAPEVLFRYLYQTTAVDMWASGVVMLCILSGCYPFFNSSTDLLALAEIMTIFGTDHTISVAAKFGRRIVCSEQKRGIDLKKLCLRLRNRASKKNENSKGEKKHFKYPKCRDCFQTIQNDGCLCISDELSKGSDNFQDENNVFTFPDSAFDLLNRLLDLDPTTRITAAEALEHPFITDDENEVVSWSPALFI